MLLFCYSKHINTTQNGEIKQAKNQMRCQSSTINKCRIYYNNINMNIHEEDKNPSLMHDKCIEKFIKLIAKEKITKNIVTKFTPLAALFMSSHDKILYLEV